MMTRKTDSILDVSGLTKTYGSVQAVDDISFSVDTGEIVGILGPNGAGKTTMIKCMLGLVEPTAGDVRVDGVSVAAAPRAAYARIGAMLEGARNVYWRLTVRENLAFFSRLVGKDPRSQAARHDELLHRFDLADKADTTVNDLSRGQKQKTALACSLARDVEVIFLDEPTLGLDVESSNVLRTELARLVAEDDLTVVLSSHDMDTIQALCDRVIVLQDGAIIADDAVEELVRLFEARTFTITVDSRPPTEFAKLASVDIETHPDGAAVTGSFTDPTELYRVLESLVSASIRLESIEVSDPTLEESFLRLTNGGDDVEAVPPARPVTPVGGSA